MLMGFGGSLKNVCSDKERRRKKRVANESYSLDC